VKRAYLVSKGAAADVREITQYTVAEWGETQCKSDIADLDAAANAVAKGEGAFKEMSSLLPGLRMARSGTHCIFCMPQDKGPAIILAVLHERMDLMVRLKSRLE
jgi:toxin ParE1/3/4